jgi:hypothetical protein
LYRKSPSSAAKHSTQPIGGACAADSAFDRARRRLGDYVDNALARSLGDLDERVLERHGGSRIAVPVLRYGRSTPMTYFIA